MSAQAHTGERGRTDEVSETEATGATLPFEIPDDLYIPPGGLEVITQSFEGPLDLLLYLIRKNKFDVLDLPMAEIADQYARYIELMEIIQMDIAGEYLAMAATLAKIKSRMLLPAREMEDEEEQIDPRLELARRLEEYERIKRLSGWLESQPRVGRDLFLAQCEGIVQPRAVSQPTFSLAELCDAFKSALELAEAEKSMVLGRDTLSVKDRVAAIVEALRTSSGHLSFKDLFDAGEGRAGMVVTMLAVLELVNSNAAYAVQADAESQIYVHLNQE